MAYTKTQWENGKTKLNAENLNKIEDGLVALVKDLEKHLNENNPHIDSASINHNHTISDITDLQNSLNNKSDITHGHTMYDVLELNGTINDINYAISQKAGLSHTHSIAQVTSLQNTLNGKAPYEHSHKISDVTNLQDSLNNKQAALGFTPIQQGGGTGQKDNKLYIGWSGTALKAQVDATDMGNIITDGAANNATLPVSKITGTLPVSKGGTGTTSAAAIIETITNSYFHFGTVGDASSGSTSAYKNVIYTTPVVFDGVSYTLIINPSPAEVTSSMIGIRRNKTGNTNIGHSSWNSGNSNSDWSFKATPNGHA